jgi:adenosylmethionine-8-amino-7-oxononanoate aminotransferase
VVVVMPPLTTTPEEVDRVVDALAASILAVASEDGR